MKACVEDYHVKMRLAEISRSSQLQTTTLLLYNIRAESHCTRSFRFLSRNKGNCSRFLINASLMHAIVTDSTSQTPESRRPRRPSILTLFNKMPQLVEYDLSVLVQVSPTQIFQPLTPPSCANSILSAPHTRPMRTPYGI